MKKSSSTIIPLEPDTHKELDKVLKAGGSAQVMVEGSDAVFLMTKAEKGSDYEFTQVAAQPSNEGMRSALEKIKDKM